MEKYNIYTFIIFFYTYCVVPQHWCHMLYTVK